MLQLAILVSTGVYFWGVWKFWKGFTRTNFQQNRLPLALLWPVLLIGNGSYRRNFKRALKG